MSSRRNDFHLDLQKLNARMSEAGYNESSLSERSGKSRGWFYTIKKMDSPRVNLSDARSMAYFLNCEIDDIGNQESNLYHSPIKFDYEAGAVSKFKNLLPQNAELLYDLMFYLELAEQKKKEALRLFIARPYAMVKPEPIPYNVQWWKVLYISSLCDKLIQELKICTDYTENDFLDRYNKLVNSTQKGKENKENRTQRNPASGTQDEKTKPILDYNTRTKLMSDILHRTVAKEIQDILDDNDFVKKVSREVSNCLCGIMEKCIQNSINSGERDGDKILDKVCNICAEFLVAYFEDLSIDHRLRVEQLKKSAQREV